MYFSSDSDQIGDNSDKQKSTLTLKRKSDSTISDTNVSKKVSTSAYNISSGKRVVHVVQKSQRTKAGGRASSIDDTKDSIISSEKDSQSAREEYDRRIGILNQIQSKKYVDKMQKRRDLDDHVRSALNNIVRAVDDNDTEELLVKKNSSAYSVQKDEFSSEKNAGSTALPPIRSSEVSHERNVSRPPSVKDSDTSSSVIVGSDVKDSERKSSKMSAVTNNNFIDKLNVRETINEFIKNESIDDAKKAKVRADAKSEKNLNNPEILSGEKLVKPRIDMSDLLSVNIDKKNVDNNKTHNVGSIEFDSEVKVQKPDNDIKFVKNDGDTNKFANTSKNKIIKDKDTKEDSKVVKPTLLSDLFTNSGDNKKHYKKSEIKKSVFEKDSSGGSKKSSSRVRSSFSDDVSSLVGDDRRSWKFAIDQGIIENERIRVRELFSKRKSKKGKSSYNSYHSNISTVRQNVLIPDMINIVEFARRVSMKLSDLRRFIKGKSVSIDENGMIDGDDAQIIAEEMGHRVERILSNSVDSKIAALKILDSYDMMLPCAPVVTIMGHVDHGKTSLLDALRTTNVAGGEAGGITQKIGAYQLSIGNGKLITFIDTPGHEAFTAMRARGANATDIAILVVAADDGVMPQTIEAINHIKSANVSMIVAINKIDKPGANVNKIMQDLMRYDVILEAMGGDVLSVEVSAIKHINLDGLLNSILLQAEVNDIRSNPNRLADGIILESRVDHGCGNCLSVLIKSGTLKVGDCVLVDGAYGIVRLMLDFNGNKIESAGPACPVEIIGMGSASESGQRFVVVESQKIAKDIVAEYKAELLEKKNVSSDPYSDVFSSFVNSKKSEEVEKISFALIFKCDTQGAVDALENVVGNITAEDVEINVLHKGVGNISESDILLASVASKAIVYGFNVDVDHNASTLLKSKSNVSVKTYGIVYDIVDDIRKEILKVMSPIVVENHLGSAVVRDVFEISGKKNAKVLGCYVTDGVMRRDANIVILRNNVEVFKGKMDSLRRFKDDVNEVRYNFECGVSVSNFDNPQVGDIIKACEIKEQNRKSL